MYDAWETIPCNPANVQNYQCQVNFWKKSSSQQKSFHCGVESLGVFARHKMVAFDDGQLRVRQTLVNESSV